MSNLAVYILGSVVLAVGLGYGVYLLGLGTAWIFVIGAIVLGSGIMGGVKKTRKTEESPKDES